MVVVVTVILSPGWTLPYVFSASVVVLLTFACSPPSRFDRGVVRC